MEPSLCRNLRLFVLSCASVNTLPFQSVRLFTFPSALPTNTSPTCTAGRRTSNQASCNYRTIYGIQRFVQPGAFLQTNMEQRAQQIGFYTRFISNEQWCSSRRILLEMRWCLSSCQKLTFSSLGGQHGGTRGDGELEPPERNQERFFSDERKSTPISLCSISHESVMICLVDMGF